MFDWNTELPANARPHHAGPSVRFGERAAGVQVVDETLRDGLQNASGVNPDIERKVDLLHGMVGVGVDVVSVGLPAAGPIHEEHCLRLCAEIVNAKLPLIPTAAARTVAADVAGIARASQKGGLPIEVYAFIGSSPIRHDAEAWSREFLLNAVRAAAKEARLHELPFCLVTEDTTRSHPDMLRELFRAAIDEGAVRLCLCDTTGHVTPYGVEELIRFVREELETIGATHVGLDWHAHNDRGLALQTALWAASHGVDRVHGTGLGVGERVGNTPLELLVENLAAIGARPTVPRAKLESYCQLAARALHWKIAPDHPVAGERTLKERDQQRQYRAAAEPSAPVEPLVPMTLRFQDETVSLAVPPRRTLLEALRYDLDLIGTKQGCDKGDCGACTVRLNGEAVLSCLTLALEADGAQIETVETLASAAGKGDNGERDELSYLDPLVDCFDRAGGGQCGFCTPGMLMSASSLLQKTPDPTDDQIKLAISGNLCRCTGYGPIVRAIKEAARLRRGEGPSGDLPELPLLGRECAPPPLAPNRSKPTKPSAAPPGARSNS